MTTKETYIIIIWVIIIASLFFLMGVKYTDVKNNQFQYQMIIRPSFKINTADSIVLYDGSRKIGTAALSYGEPFADLIMEDISK